MSLQLPASPYQETSMGVEQQPVTMQRGARENKGYLLSSVSSAWIHWKWQPKLWPDRHKLDPQPLLQEQSPFHALTAVIEAQGGYLLSLAGGNCLSVFQG